jgi:hypothetical protein
MRMLPLLLASLVFAHAVSAQTTTPHDTPCTGSLEVDGERPFSLQGMVRGSDVILIGTVAQVLPAEWADPTRQPFGLIWTQSVLSVDQVLFGSVGNSERLALRQMGGKIPPYNQFVAGDPIVKSGERYVLFLLRDDSKLPINNSGLARFASVGKGDGMVKVVDGKVQISCEATPELKKYDNTEFATFVSTVRSIIAAMK